MTGEHRKGVTGLPNPRGEVSGMAKFGVLVFPGTNCEIDVLRVLRDLLHQDAELVWYEERDLERYDAVILPGGFSYGDYLRAGAMARWTPVIEAVYAAAEKGRLILGICNGFQILTEAGLLPGALQRNRHLRYVCGWTHVRVERTDTPFTSAYRKGQVLRIPISHGEGNFYADPDALAEIEKRGQVLLRYATPDGQLTETANPNGSLHHIAGIMNTAGNVMGLMPHPERACEAVLGSEDGCGIFASMIHYLTKGRVFHVG